MQFFKISLYIFTTVQICFGANILGFFSIPSVSHQSSKQELMKTLALRGHNITMITPEPIKEDIPPNMKQIDLHKISHAVFDKYNISQCGTTKEKSGSDTSMYIKAVIELAKTHLSHPYVKKLFRNEIEESFDLIIIEYISLPAVYLKLYYDVPMIGISSMPMNSINHRLMGNPAHPITHPDQNMHFTRNLNFRQRLISTFDYIFWQLMSGKIRDMTEDVMKTIDPEFSTDELKRHPVDMVFANSNPALQVPRPNVPAIVDIYGLHIKEPKPLPKDLQEFMDKAKQGVVYISFGSIIKSSEFPRDRINVILETIEALPFKVLWKFEADNLPYIPKNLKILKWVPQQDLLRHPNLRVFVMQAGLQSWEEALYTKTPLVVLPLCGDGFGNALKIVERGMGTALDFLTFTKDDLINAIKDTASNNMIKKNLEELYKIAIDQPMTGMEKAIWWTEYVLRHNGTNHFRTPDIPSYQYFFLDIIGFVMAVLIIAILLIKMLLKLLFKTVKSVFFNYVKTKSD